MPQSLNLYETHESKIHGEMSSVFHHQTQGSTAQDSAKKVSSQTRTQPSNAQNTVNTSIGSFNRKFYNLDRSNKKRDLTQISLHNHPKGNLLGILEHHDVYNPRESQKRALAKKAHRHGQSHMLDSLKISQNDLMRIRKTEVNNSVELPRRHQLDRASQMKYMAAIANQTVKSNSSFPVGYQEISSSLPKSGSRKINLQSHDQLSKLLPEIKKGMSGTMREDMSQTAIHTLNLNRTSQQDQYFSVLRGNLTNQMRSATKDVTPIASRQNTNVNLVDLKSHQNSSVYSEKGKHLRNSSWTSKQSPLPSAHEMRKKKVFAASPESLIKKRAPFGSKYQVEPSEYTQASLKHFIKNTTTFKGASNDKNVHSRSYGMPRYFKGNPLGSDSDRSGSQTKARTSPRGTSNSPSPRKDYVPTFMASSKSKPINQQDQANLKKEALDATVQKRVSGILNQDSIKIFDSKQSRKLYSIISKKVDEIEEKSQRRALLNPTTNSKSNASTDMISFQNRVFNKATAVNPMLMLTPSQANTLDAGAPAGAATNPKESIGDSSIGGWNDGRESPQLLARLLTPKNQEIKVGEQSLEVQGKAAASALRKKQKIQVNGENVPDLFEKKGPSEFDLLKKRFQDDVFQYLKLDDKHTVFMIIKNLRYDVRRRNEREGALPGDLKNGWKRFPGDEEAFARVEREMTMRHENLKTESMLSERDNFFAVNTHTDFMQIFKHQSEEEFAWMINQMIKDFNDRSEIVGGLLDMIGTKLHHYIPEQDRDVQLTNYIKYLIGETNNKDFRYNKEEFSQKFELNRKSLSMPFEEYAVQEENSMKTVANDIIERVDYNSIIAHSADPISVEKNANNPKHVFFKLCTKEYDLAIPLLAKVVNKQLSLYNYLISLGHIRAFCKTFNYNKDFVSKFLFHNCGLTDAHNDILFTSMMQLQTVSHLTLQQNEFGIKSVTALRDLLLRPRPNHLQSLRIVNCKIGAQSMSRLIEYIREKSSLKVLGLVNVKLSERLMAQLGLYINENRKIQEVDVAWNILRPSAYHNLLSGLGECRNLTSVNLAWNKLVDESEQFIVEDPKRKTKTKLMAQSPTATMKSNISNDSKEQEKQWYEQEVKWTDHTVHVISNLETLIKRNKNLQHLNLENTGLSEFMILKIAKAMRRARSLCAIHLCGNRGVTNRIKIRLHEQLRCMKPYEVNVFKPSELHYLNAEHSKHELLIKQLDEEEEVEGEKPVARQTIKIKQIMARKKIESRVNQFIEHEGDRLILTRYLGHKPEMPGSGQWKMITDKSQECWICDQQVYSLIFWDKDYISKKAVKMNPQQEERILTKLREICPVEVEEQVECANPGIPIVYGDFTNWQPKPFQEIVKFSQIFEDKYDEEVVFDMMQNDKVIKTSVYEHSQLNERQKKRFVEYQGKYIRQQIQGEWKQILAKHLRYKKPFLVHGANTRQDCWQNLWVIPTFLTVGKHEFIVKYQHKYYLYNSISDIRVEEIPPFVKVSQSKVQVRIFKKEHSVFAPWKEDTALSLKQALQIDSENWKVHKMVKDKEDYERILKLCDSNYSYLKDVFLDYSTNSTYPFIQMIDTSVFCEDAGFVDSRFKITQNDLMYISTESKTKGLIKNKSGLIRCEFMEFLIRIADFKFKQTGMVKTFSDAFKMLLEDYIKPKITPQSWMGFRTEELWNLECHDVFHVNMEGIQKLHKYYFTPTQKYMSNKDAIRLMTADTTLMLTSKQAKYCLGYCKMTVKDEVYDFDKYIKLQLVELLEMLGRAAKVKFIGQEIEDEPLHIKIEHVLDMVFPLINYQRKDVNIEVDSESESDNDY